MTVLRKQTEALGLDFGAFWTTYDTWKTGILDYFDGRHTSAAVEGINNKARVITKRCYGVKLAGTLLSRLILDLNRASEAVGRSIAELREMVSGLKAVFLGFCTQNRKSLIFYQIRVEMVAYPADSATQRNGLMVARVLARISP